MSRTTTTTATARRTLLLAGTILLSTAPPTEAQTPPRPEARWEIVLPSGWLVPTGAQRDAMERGGLSAVQAAYVVRPSLAVTATLGWARSRHVASTDDPKVDVFTYDVGAEVRLPRWISAGRLAFRPFAGVGGGARSYNFRSLDEDAKHNVAAYGSVGGEVDLGRVRLRLEARDYVAGFKPLVGDGAAVTRNDVALMAGLRIARRSHP